MFPVVAASLPRSSRLGILRICAALALVSIVNATGCTADAGCAPSSSVAVPATADPPSRTVTAYLPAVNAHDARTMNILSTPSFADREQSGAARILCDWSVSDVEIIGMHDDRDPRGRFHDVVYVSVAFELHQRSDDPTMPNGHRDWGYWLGRNKPTERWLIYDSGVE